jgi:tRNA (guanosine-2'-O-)-methyltransferase
MTERRREKFLQVIANRQSDLTIVMEDIHDPHNVSAMLRSADAVGVNEVQLLYINEEFPKLGKKSSATASKWVKRRKFSVIKECYNTLHAEGYTIYATHMGKKSKSLYELDLTKKIAIVFGNEHRGVSSEAAKLADENFLISVACAVTLYEAFRQRFLKSGDHSFTPDEKEKLFLEWLKK